MCNQLPQDDTVAEDIGLHTRQHCEVAIYLGMLVGLLLFSMLLPAKRGAHMSSTIS